jgi:NADH:ubiquinone oxidoreductase subunit 4 (subunit M)
MLIKLKGFFMFFKNYIHLLLILFIIFILNLLLKSNIALNVIQLLDDCGFIILYVAFMLIIAYPSYYKKTFVLKLYWLLITLGAFFLSILKINYLQPINYIVEPVGNWIKNTEFFFYLNLDKLTITFLWAEQYFFFKVSSYFVLLTTFIFCICAYNNIKRVRYSRVFILLFLLLEIFLIKAFTTLNLLEFYIYFEGVLIPMYALLLL